MSKAGRMRRRRRGSSSTDVTVTRVYDGPLYARVSTIGHTGDRPFVLVPGIGVSSTYFERLAPNLNEFGPVHALDLPGFGGVPHPGSAMSIRGYADLLGKVIDDLEMNDPIIVGHSMGTQIVADLAARRPDISTIVLIGPVVNPRERSVPLQAIRFLQASWHEPFAVKVLAVGGYLMTGFKWFSRILPVMMRYPIEKRMTEITAHTLLIRGEHDHVCPRPWAEHLAEQLPLSRLWELPASAHSVMHAHAEEVAKLCVEHARQAHTARDDDRLHTYPDNAVSGDDDIPSPSIGQRLEGIRGRIIETTGVITDDDETLERGKTIHAEAMLETEDEDPAR